MGKKLPNFSTDQSPAKGGQPKAVVLDTTVLLFDPECLSSFPQTTVYLPLSVIEELDSFRYQLNEAGRHARQVVGFLDELRAQHRTQQPLTLENGAAVHFWVDHQSNAALPFHSNLGRSSNLVLSACLNIVEAQRKNDPSFHLMLVTNDSNLRLRASALGVETISFQPNNSQLEKSYETILEIPISKQEQEDFVQFDHLPWGDDRPKLHPNQHVVLIHEKKQLARYIERSKVLKNVAPSSIWNIQPRNLEQIAAIDLLLDPSIDILALVGKAGTGKTLLALAAALHSLGAGENRKILISRPIIPMGKDLGYLPGDIEEKISPWMKPIFDNLEFLLHNNQKKPLPIANVHQLREKGILELEPLTYIRGRSIPNRFMIVDEAQNLTPLEVKTVITRVGNHTKLILTGDPFQIDNPYVDSTTNGLSYVMEKLKPFPLAAHVQLQKGERSPLAELAANIL